MCMSVLSRLKLPMQRIRFGSSTRLSPMVMLWFVGNGVSSLSVLFPLVFAAWEGTTIDPQML